MRHAIRLICFGLLAVGAAGCESTRWNWLKREGNEELHRRLQARGVAHEFALRPGGHGYDYVRSALAYSLRFLGRALGGLAKEP